MSREVTAICPCVWTATTFSRAELREMSVSWLNFGYYFNTDAAAWVREHGYAKFDFSPVASVLLRRIKSVRLFFEVESGWTYANTGIELDRVLKDVTQDLNWLRYATGKNWATAGGLAIGSDIAIIRNAGSESNFVSGVTDWPITAETFELIRNNNSAICFRVPTMSSNPANGVKAVLSPMSSIYFEVVYETERAGAVTMF